jgi:nuclear pore complex protein Nup155
MLTRAVLFAVMEARSFLGVFPEISRAWFTVDNRLYLWDYEAG